MKNLKAYKDTNLNAELLSLSNGITHGSPNGLESWRKLFSKPRGQLSGNEKCNNCGQKMESGRPKNAKNCLRPECTLDRTWKVNSKRVKLTPWKISVE